MLREREDEAEAIGDSLAIRDTMALAGDTMFDRKYTVAQAPAARP
jgi:hypothetical protein